MAHRHSDSTRLVLNVCQRASQNLYLSRKGCLYRIVCRTENIVLFTFSKSARFSRYGEWSARNLAGYRCVRVSERSRIPRKLPISGSFCTTPEFLKIGDEIGNSFCRLSLVCSVRLMQVDGIC